MDITTACLTTNIDSFKNRDMERVGIAWCGPVLGTGTMMLIQWSEIHESLKALLTLALLIGAVFACFVSYYTIKERRLNIKIKSADTVCPVKESERPEDCPIKGLVENKQITY